VRGSAGLSVRPAHGVVTEGTTRGLRRAGTAGSAAVPSRQHARLRCTSSGSELPY
jgi:hypothetical protein